MSRMRDAVKAVVRFRTRLKNRRVMGALMADGNVKIMWRRLVDGQAADESVRMSPEAAAATGAMMMKLVEEGVDKGTGEGWDELRAYASKRMTRAQDRYLDAVHDLEVELELAKAALRELREAIWIEMPIEKRGKRLMDALLKAGGAL